MSAREQIFQSIDSLSPIQKSAIMRSFDLVTVVFAFYLAIALRLNAFWPEQVIRQSVPLLLLLLVLSPIVGHFLNIYSVRLRSYESSSAVRSALWAGSCSLTVFFVNIVFQMGTPRTVPIIFGLLAFFMAFSSRLFLVQALNWLSEEQKKRVPIAVYGAGSGGVQLVSALQSSTDYKPVLLVDDDKTRQRIMIGGLKVQPTSKLEQFAKSGKISEIFLAFPSLSDSRKQQILTDLKPLNCRVSELPPYEAILRSGGVLPAMRPIEADELLGRDGIDLNFPELVESYANKSILVTGAGGSIGSELCRRILEIGVKKIVLFELSELGLYQIERDLKSKIGESTGADVEIVSILGSINQRTLIERVLTEHKIEIVLHAAAYKHVPLVECNPCEGLRNNVLGTRTLAEAAKDCGVQRFIMISTDKAVRPTGVMGASKRIAELVVQDTQSRTDGCVFGIVRFGNVLGSSGSVIPLFREQIKSGGPVTLTHPDVTRYFMSVTEAAHLVLLAGAFAEGGEVFVLDMGEPVKIEDLAKRMIELSGLTLRSASNPNGDIEITTTGLRIGEKLYEELLVSKDMLETPHPKILRAQEKSVAAGKLESAIMELEDAILENKTDKLDTIIDGLVENYRAAL